MSGSSFHVPPQRNPSPDRLGPVHQPGMFNIDALRNGEWHGGMNRATLADAVAAAIQWREEDGMRYRVVDPSGAVVFDTVAAALEATRRVASGAPHAFVAERIGKIRAQMEEFARRGDPAAAMIFVAKCAEKLHSVEDAAKRLVRGDG